MRGDEGVRRDKLAVVIVCPEVEPRASCGDELKELDRVAHVVEHAACDYEVEYLLAPTQVFDEVAKPEVGPIEAERGLHDEASQKRGLVRLNRDDPPRAGTVQHVHMPSLERPELEHIRIGDVELLEQPGDPHVAEQV